MDIPPATTEKIPGDPLIVHISDIHGYLTDAQSALGAVGDAEQYPDLVTTDESDQLHWADNDYILVTLFCRRLLILASCRCGVEEDKDTASAVSDTNDSARCVWVGIGRSGPAPTGSLA
jgi:hypothetical protein